MQKHIVALVIAFGETFNTEIEIEVPEGEDFVMPVIEGVGPIVSAICDNLQFDWEYTYDEFKDSCDGKVSVDVVNDSQVIIHNNSDIHIILTDFNS